MVWLDAGHGHEDCVAKLGDADPGGTASESSQSAIPGLGEADLHGAGAGRRKLAGPTPSEERWLFVGWKCGWETTPNSQYAYFQDGNSYYGRADNPTWDNARRQTIGYNAAKTAGLLSSGVLDYEHHYDVFMEIIGRHLQFLATTARSLGIPRDRIFVHTIAQGVDRYNLTSQFNADSNPSPSYYGKPTSSLRDNPSFMRCLQKGQEELGTTGYGYGEFHLGATDYDTWRQWFTTTLRDDPNCLFQALYNYDTMQGHPEIERAMLETMKSAPAPPGGGRSRGNR